jgi:hypothetical protein
MPGLSTVQLLSAPAVVVALRLSLATLAGLPLAASRIASTVELPSGVVTRYAATDAINTYTEAEVSASPTPAPWYDARRALGADGRARENGPPQSSGSRRRRAPALAAAATSLQLNMEILVYAPLSVQASDDGSGASLADFQNALADSIAKALVGNFSDAASTAAVFSQLVQKLAEAGLPVSGVSLDSSSVVAAVSRPRYSPSNAPVPAAVAPDTTLTSGALALIACGVALAIAAVGGGVALAWRRRAAAEAAAAEKKSTAEAAAKQSAAADEQLRTGAGAAGVAGTGAPFTEPPAAPLLAVSMRLAPARGGAPAAPLPRVLRLPAPAGAPLAPSLPAIFSARRGVLRALARAGAGAAARAALRASARLAWARGSFDAAFHVHRELPQCAAEARMEAAALASSSRRAARAREAAAKAARAALSRARGGGGGARVALPPIGAPPPATAAAREGGFTWGPRAGTSHRDSALFPANLSFLRAAAAARGGGASAHRFVTSIARLAVRALYATVARGFSARSGGGGVGGAATWHLRPRTRFQLARALLADCAFRRLRAAAEAAVARRTRRCAAEESRRVRLPLPPLAVLLTPAPPSPPPPPPPPPAFSFHLPPTGAAPASFALTPHASLPPPPPPTPFVFAPVFSAAASAAPQPPRAARDARTPPAARSPPAGAGVRLGAPPGAPRPPAPLPQLPPPASSPPRPPSPSAAAANDEFFALFGQLAGADAGAAAGAAAGGTHAGVPLPGSPSHLRVLIERSDGTVTAPSPQGGGGGGARASRPFSAARSRQRDGKAGDGDSDSGGDGDATAPPPPPPLPSKGVASSTRRALFPAAAAPQAPPAPLEWLHGVMLSSGASGPGAALSQRAQAAASAAATAAAAASAAAAAAATAADAAAAMRKGNPARAATALLLSPSGGTFRPRAAREAPPARASPAPMPAVSPPRVAWDATDAVTRQATLMFSPASAAESSARGAPRASGAEEGSGGVPPYTRASGAHVNLSVSSGSGGGGGGGGGGAALLPRAPALPLGLPPGAPRARAAAPATGRVAPLPPAAPPPRARSAAAASAPSTSGAGLLLLGASPLLAVRAGARAPPSKAAVSRPP